MTNNDGRLPSAPGFREPDPQAVPALRASIPSAGEWPGLTMTFTEMAAALSVVHSISRPKMLAFNGRIKRLQAVGLLGSGPGRGRERLLSMKEFIQVGVALELLQSGVGPDHATRCLNSTWDSLWPHILDASTWPHVPSCWAVLSVEFLSEDLGEAAPAPVWNVVHGHPSLSGASGRFLCIDLGRMLVKLFAALGITINRDPEAVRASAIEAGRAETERLGAQQESAVGATDAPTQSGQE